MTETTYESLPAQVTPLDRHAAELDNLASRLSSTTRLIVDCTKTIIEISEEMAKARQRIEHLAAGMDEGGARG